MVFITRGIQHASNNISQFYNNHKTTFVKFAISGLAIGIIASFVHRNYECDYLKLPRKHNYVFDCECVKNSNMLQNIFNEYEQYRFEECAKSVLIAYSSIGIVAGLVAGFAKSIFDTVTHRRQ